MTGRFITFEGGEGTGKSTQARRLTARLRALGLEVVETREPGGSPLAERVRELILSDKPQSPTAEFLLFAAARAEHLAATIRPALERDAWVVCDRFIDSSRVYQGDIGKVSPDLISAIEHLTVAPWFPDLTLVLDLAPKVGMARAAERGELSRFDAAHGETHAGVRAGFLKIAKAEPRRCVVVNAAGDVDSVERDVWQAVASRLGIQATAGAKGHPA